ncbi:MAG: DNA-binding response regulator [Crocinitomicaceae bacterium]|nr:DNA-binding response regulator [Crocinitomicaceae bacterium]|tara:strand:- start:16234 stop:16977 length:744 start_codon:yes stop_codon:yes gene_type:complete
MKVLIVDDERKIRKAIRSLIEYSSPDVKVIAEANGVKNALEVLNKYHPDLIFLDVRLGDGSGFDLLKNMQSKSIKIVFVTAYDQYAIKAFKFNAIDYLLKPVSEQDLVRSIKRAKEQILFKEEILRSHQGLLDSISKTSSDRMVIRTAEAIHVIQKADIIRCEADINYTLFYLIDGRKIVVSKTLKEFENELKNDGFIRIHRSHLVNINMIKSYRRSNQHKMLLTNGIELPVSVRRREQVLRRLSWI